MCYEHGVGIGGELLQISWLAAAARNGPFLAPEIYQTLFFLGSTCCSRVSPKPVEYRVLYILIWLDRPSRRRARSSGGLFYQG